MKRYFTDLNEMPNGDIICAHCLDAYLVRNPTDEDEIGHVETIDDDPEAVFYCDDCGCDFTEEESDISESGSWMDVLINMNKS